VSYLNIIVKKYDKYLLGAIVLLCVFGTTMLFSASSIRSLEITSSRTDTLYLQAHLKRLIVGIFFMFFFMMFDYRRLKKWSLYILGGAVGLLILTLIMNVFQGTSGPSRWMYIGQFSIQTSDISRVALIIFLAAFIHEKRDKIKDFYNGYMICVLAVASVTTLIVLQPDFSTTVMILIISFVMLFLGGARFQHMMATIGVSLPILAITILNWTYMRGRLMSFISPEKVNPDSLHQIKQSMISLANGGFFGLGLGNSFGKNHFLPTPHTDFIFAIVGEETGLLGTLFILTLFMFIFQRGIQIAKESPDIFGVMLALGISCSFILYAFINAAVVTNLVPTTGLAMPLISYGGSGVVIHLASLGILLNISQSKRSVANGSDWRKRIYG